jgi:hypothetical protein
MNIFSRSVVLILVLPLLGACQTERMLAKCPSTGVLAETSSLSAFAPGRKMVPANAAYTVEIRRSTTSCSIDKDEHVADTSLEISLRGMRNRGGGAAQYRVPFFVAINDSDGNLVLKKMYSADLAFEPGQTQVDFTQSIDSIPIRMARSKQAYEYHLIVGLQLTRQQLDYNRTYSRYAQ